MADENYSSLREAINRIVGAPAGGAQTAGQVMEPSAPYSQDLQSVTPTTTTAALSNTPFDPYAAQEAEQAASLAALTAQNDQLAAQVAPSAAAPSTTALTPYQEAAQKAGYDENRWRSGLASAGTKPEQIEDILMVQKAQMGLLPKIAPGTSESQIRSTMGSYGAPQKNIDATVKYHAALAKSMLPTGSATGMTTPVRMSAPVNPGPRAPWQESQQYWKDLAAYKAAQ